MQDRTSWPNWRVAAISPQNLLAADPSRSPHLACGACLEVQCTGVRAQTQSHITQHSPQQEGNMPPSLKAAIMHLLILASGPSPFPPHLMCPHLPTALQANCLPSPSPVVVQVVDSCSPCAPNVIVLPYPTFEQLTAEPAAGQAAVRFRQVCVCPRECVSGGASNKISLPPIFKGEAQMRV